MLNVIWTEISIATDPFCHNYSRLTVRWSRKFGNDSGLSHARQSPATWQPAAACRDKKERGQAGRGPPGLAPSCLLGVGRGRSTREWEILYMWSAQSGGRQIPPIEYEQPDNAQNQAD